ncbi:GntR family transcriptional regulator [Propionibacteriaceae bacterium Y2011]
MESKADVAYAWLREQILAGEFLPRTPINADAIARRLGISKIPVREALRRLTSEGLVDYRHHAGAVVAPLSWRELAGIRAARGSLEPTAARLAATARTDDQLRGLTAQLAELADRLALGQLNDVLELNRRFHLSVAQCSQLPVLAELIDRTVGKVNRYRAVLPISHELATSNLAEHRAIVAAIEARDPDRAEAAARTHVTGEHTIAGEAHRIRGQLFADEPFPLDAEPGQIPTTQEPPPPALRR